MRIYFCNRYVTPDLSATSQLLTDLSTHLATRGMQVTLVGSRQRYDDAQATLPETERIDGVDVLRVGNSRFGRDGLAGRALDYLDYSRGVRRELTERLQPGDVVVAMTDPPLLGSALGRIAARRGAHCVHWLQDLFPEVAEAVFGGAVRMAAAPLRGWRNRGLRRSAQVVVISEGMAVRIAALGVPRERIMVIENWTDAESIRPLAAQDNPLRREWGLEGKFVIGYSGNLGRAHDWRTMLEVATRLRDRDDIRFVLIGGGRGLHEFSDEATVRKLDNVILKPYQPREALAHSLSLPDLHWLTLAPALEGCIFPSKWYGILAAGRPSLFIGKLDGEVAQRLHASQIGHAVAPGDVDGACAGIERLAGDPELVSAMGARARRLLDAHFTRDATFQRWDTMLTSIQTSP
ncbi:MAG: glycosyltransferase family 4 protein [Proteobacteria bacterium]|nr:glycosyltransferase family 4 protein [Pseudomonadota bacterium]